MRTENEPYISFVLVGRNDGYGDNFLERLNMFILNVDELSARYRLPCEIVLVEWNPPEDRPTFDSVVREPRHREFLRLTIHRVSGAIHEQIAGDYRFPLLEFYGKNAGAYRAAGEFVLITNPDIIISDRLFSLWAKRSLYPNCFYRAVRKDVVALAADAEPGVDELQTHCAANVIRIQSIYGAVDLGAATWGERLRRFGAVRLRRLFKAVLPNYRLFTNAAGDFLLTHRDNFRAMAGYPEQLRNAYLDGVACYLLNNHGLPERVFADGACVYHQDHARHPKSGLIEYRLKLLKLIRRKVRRVNDPATWGLQGEGLDCVQL